MHICDRMRPALASGMARLLMSDALVIRRQDSSDVMWLSWNFGIASARPMLVRNAWKPGSIASPPSPGTGVCAAAEGSFFAPPFLPDFFFLPAVDVLLSIASSSSSTVTNASSSL